jgi:hypothetical protein
MEKAASPEVVTVLRLVESVTLVHQLKETTLLRKQRQEDAWQGKREEQMKQAAEPRELEYSAPGGVRGRGCGASRGCRGREAWVRPDCDRQRAKTARTTTSCRRRNLAS